ncbi:PaaI family thioesterase [Desertibaculum subflavum]|uniref:PaaI family thioesterase n=1 Tax=Desertibaculum subflavum TaxID=2268458 RepID=UPI0013C3EC37
MTEDFLAVNGPLYARRDGNQLALGFRVEQRHCNPAQSCHGGMLMTFADMQLAIGANFAGDLKRFLPTVSLTSDFLAPAPLGSWVEGRAEIARQARTLVFAHALISADGNPVVRANGIFQIRGEPDPRFDIRALFA